MDAGDRAIAAVLIAEEQVRLAAVVVDRVAGGEIERTPRHRAVGVADAVVDAIAVVADLRGLDHVVAADRPGVGRIRIGGDRVGGLRVGLAAVGSRDGVDAVATTSGIDRSSAAAVVAAGGGEQREDGEEGGTS